jgi:tol-pal system protein YbgF
VTLLVSAGRKRSRLAFTFSVGLLALILGPGPSFAQQGGDSIDARLSRVEQKLADLQALVGALQSFARSNPGAAPLPDANSGAAVAEPSPGQGDVGGRVAALETQIGALTAELEQINQRLNALNGMPAAQAPAPPVPLLPNTPPPDRQGDAGPPPDAAVAAMAASAADAGDPSDTSKPRWYGPRPGEEQTSALSPGAPQPLLPPAAQGEANVGPPQSQMAALPGDDAHSLFDKGQGALTEKDYAGAEAAFRQLTKTYPKDPLAADAQYWIGESYYRRGQYKNAADAFLKGYKKHKSGDKAPETLLKLGMSLAALGQKEAACSTFGELKAKYPKAPETVRDEAKAERKKAGC